MPIIQRCPQSGSPPSTSQGDLTMQTDVIECLDKRAGARIDAQDRLYAIAPGCFMPALGFGTWKIDAGHAANSVKAALDSGYRHIDCAPVYGNEAEVGIAIREAIRRDGELRSKLWITSKLWNAEHHPSRVRNACLASVSALGVDHLDLYLVHWPVAFRAGVQWPDAVDDILGMQADRLLETWTAMEALVDEGLVRCIGVSNCSVQVLDDIVRGARRRPAVNQVECHPYLQQRALAACCGSHGIHLTAYSPLGSPDRPATLRHINERRVIDDPCIAEIAHRHAATPAVVLLAWHLAKGRSVLCKSTSPSRLIENLGARSLGLSFEDIGAIDAICLQQRYVSPEAWFRPGSVLTEDLLWGDAGSGPA